MSQQLQQAVGHRTHALRRICLALRRRRRLVLAVAPRRADPGLALGGALPLAQPHHAGAHLPVLLREWIVAVPALAPAQRGRRRRGRSARPPHPLQAPAQPCCLSPLRSARRTRRPAARRPGWRRSSWSGRGQTGSSARPPPCRRAAASDGAGLGCDHFAPTRRPSHKQPSRRRPTDLSTAKAPLSAAGQQLSSSLKPRAPPAAQASITCRRGQRGRPGQVAIGRSAHANAGGQDGVARPPAAGTCTCISAATAGLGRPLACGGGMCMTASWVGTCGSEAAVCLTHSRASRCMQPLQQGSRRNRRRSGQARRGCCLSCWRRHLGRHFRCPVRPGPWHPPAVLHAVAALVPGVQQPEARHGLQPAGVVDVEVVVGVAADVGGALRSSAGAGAE